MIVLDKPLVPKVLSAREKNLMYHKFALKTLCQHPDHRSSVKLHGKLSAQTSLADQSAAASQSKLDEEQASAASSGDPFELETPDLSSLETFGMESIQVKCGATRRPKKMHSVDKGIDSNPPIKLETRAAVGSNSRVEMESLVAVTQAGKSSQLTEKPNVALEVSVTKNTVKTSFESTSSKSLETSREQMDTSIDSDEGDKLFIDYKSPAHTPRYPPLNIDNLKASVPFTTASVHKVDVETEAPSKGGEVVAKVMDVGDSESKEVCSANVTVSPSVIAKDSTSDTSISISNVSENTSAECPEDTDSAEENNGIISGLRSPIRERKLKVPVIEDSDSEEINTEQVQEEPARHSDASLVDSRRSTGSDVLMGEFLPSRLCQSNSDQSKVIAHTKGSVH